MCQNFITLPLKHTWKYAARAWSLLMSRPVLLPDEAIKPYIRWVDDNHAVLVCANVTAGMG